MKHPEVWIRALISDNCTSCEVTEELIGIVHKLEDFEEKYPSICEYLALIGLSVTETRVALETALSALE